MDDIIKEIGYTINGTEVGFFGVVLQREGDRIVPTYISIGGESDEIKDAMADSLIRIAESIKESIKTEKCWENQIVATTARSPSRKRAARNTGQKKTKLNCNLKKAGI